MLGLCVLGVKRMTTSKRIRAAVKEIDEYLCKTYILKALGFDSFLFCT